MQKTAVSSAGSDAFSLKKRRFLKLLRLFFSIKKVYRSDYQHLSRNAKIKRFSALNDNLPANIGCIRGQNSLFVDFIHSIRKLMHRRTKPDEEISPTPNERHVVY